MGARVPDRLGLAALVPLAPGASPGGDGVDDLAVGEGVPVPVEVCLQDPGARVVREPTMKPTPASFRRSGWRLTACRRPATTTRGSTLAAWRNCSTTLTIVVVSARLPSQQLILRGKPARSTSSPTMIWGSIRRSLE